MASIADLLWIVGSGSAAGDVAAISGSEPLPARVYLVDADDEMRLYFRKGERI
jgi:hypothetical protein